MFDISPAADANTETFFVVVLPLPLTISANVFVPPWSDFFFFPNSDESPVSPAYRCTRRRLIAAGVTTLAVSQHTITRS